MKITIDIPDDALRQMMEFTHAKTVSEAVNLASADFNRRPHLAQLADLLGTFNELMTSAELELMRRDS